MRNFLFPFCAALLFSVSLFGQVNEKPKKVQIMTFGVFHFAYHNLDFNKTDKKDQISVLDEPFHSEIVSVCNAIKEFKPTIIAVEQSLNQQKMIDSLYLSYKNGKYSLEKSEIYQMGFRIAEQLNIDKIHCVNDWGKQYTNLNDLFKDTVRYKKFSDFYFNSPDSVYKDKFKSVKINSIIDDMTKLNSPNYVKDRLSSYLMGIFKYEEKERDFTGVDFETARWFNRNLRIFRNVQRIDCDSSDRILLIIGADHLNLLNWFFDSSREFDLISPIPYLNKARFMSENRSE